MTSRPVGQEGHCILVVFCTDDKQKRLAELANFQALLVVCQLMHKMCHMRKH